MAIAILGLAGLGLLGGCGNGASDDDGSALRPPSYSDEAHRPSDWSSEIRFRVVYRSPENGVQRYEVVPGSFEVDRSLEAFVSQLFDLAFSGDATVFLPNVLGEPERSEAVEPRALITALNRFDTIYTEDLETGELVKTSIDRSFSHSRASALVVHADVRGEGGDLEFYPHMLLLGEQVFYEESGEFRGVTPKYYIQLDDPAAGNARQSFYFLTDSLGKFQLSHLGHYDTPEDQRFFNELLLGGNLPDSTLLYFTQRWRFDSRNASLSVESEIQRGKEPS